MAKIFIICSKSTLKFNPIGKMIEKRCGLGFTHFSIAIKAKGEIVISEAVWPRPRFISYEDWKKSHTPVYVFMKSTDDKKNLFEQITWMAILCTRSWYSVLQLILIYIGITIKPLTKWTQSVKLNNDQGLVCCEYIVRYLNKFHSSDFLVTVSEDSIGMQEPFEAIEKTWERVDISQLESVNVTK